MTTRRQQLWAQAAQAAAQQSNPAAALFALLAQPNEQERGPAPGHLRAGCSNHDARGFRTREGRCGWRCGVCGAFLHWREP